MRNTEVKLQDKIKIDLYKKNGKSFNRGDLKNFSLSFRKTRLSIVVTYLVRYYHDGLIDFIRNNRSDNADVNRLRDDVLFYIDKFGDRLISLARRIQDRVCNRIFEHPIEFESLTFVSCTEQKQNIISKNKRTTSKYNAIITLPGQATPGGKIRIPVRHSESHHGSLQHYHKKPNSKGQINYSYTVIFEERGVVRIALARKKQVNRVTGKENYYGVDVNVKHNLFCDKHGNTIDYDRRLIDDYITFLRRMDEKLARKKKINKKAKLSKRDQKTKDKWSTRINGMLKEKTRYLVDQVIKLGNDHLVLEDLGDMGKSYSRSEEFLGFKYSRLIKLLNLADLKNIARSIASKMGVQTTFVQASYTSKTCDACGLICDQNRPTQERFECVGCGHQAPADTHSGKMIADRMTLDVLRHSLLTLKDGEYRPKKMDRKSIKNILTECYGFNTTDQPSCSTCKI